MDMEKMRLFFEPKSVALVGATDRKGAVGRIVLDNLLLAKDKRKVYPVNPRLKEIEGTKCYPSLSNLPVKVDVVDFVVPPPVTEEILKECKELELDRIWLQPGSESEAAVAFCDENNLKVVHGVCVMLN